MEKKNPPSRSGGGTPRRRRAGHAVPRRLAAYKTRLPARSLPRSHCDFSVRASNSSPETHQNRVQTRFFHSHPPVLSRRRAYTSSRRPPTVQGRFVAGDQGSADSCWLSCSHEEDRAQAGPARRQAEAEGAQGRLHSPRHRRDVHGHEDAEDDDRGHRRPRRRRRQAAQALPRGAHLLRRPGQGGEEGRRGQERRRRQEGRRGQEGRRRQEGGREQAAGVPALVPAAVRLRPAAAALPAVRHPQRRGGPQLLRHLLMDARRAAPPVRSVGGRSACTFLARLSVCV